MNKFECARALFVIIGLFMMAGGVAMAVDKCRRRHEHESKLPY